MLGHDAKGVTKKEIQAAFDNPIGTTRISELARGKNEVAILFDDLSRPTKVAELVPYVLKEIKEGGISDERIRFVAASGAHGAMKLMDFRKKLGTKVAIVPDATIQYFPSLINRCAEEK
jgi:nickel-dependent lactate racemase